jgi:hypothetical protein
MLTLWEHAAMVGESFVTSILAPSEEQRFRNLARIRSMHFPKLRNRFALIRSASTRARACGENLLDTWLPILQSSGGLPC